MKTFLQTQKKNSIVAAVIVIILGLLLVFWPDQSGGFLCMLLGVSILLTGVIYLFSWFSKRKKGAPTYLVIPGIILLVLGIWLMTSSTSVIILVQYIFAAILLIHGILDLQGAMALMQNRSTRWWVDLVLALITLGLSILIVVNPFGAFEALMTIIGVALIYDGISDLYIIWRLNQAFPTTASSDPSAKQGRGKQADAQQTDVKQDDTKQPPKQ
jgi:uncharacterized membrane protein HdeD (DUF308 family)